MRYNGKPYSQLLPLAPCRRWGGVSTWHCLSFPSFEMGFPIPFWYVAWCIKFFCPLLCCFYWQLVLAMDVFLSWKEKMFKDKFHSVLYWSSAKPCLENPCEGQRRSGKRTHDNRGGPGFPAFVRRAGRRRGLTCMSCYPISSCGGRAQESVDCRWRQPVRWAHRWQAVVQSTGYNDVRDLWIWNNDVKFIHQLGGKLKTEGGKICSSVPPPLHTL